MLSSCLLDVSTRGVDRCPPHRGMKSRQRQTPPSTPERTVEDAAGRSRRRRAPETSPEHSVWGQRWHTATCSRVECGATITPEPVVGVLNRSLECGATRCGRCTDDRGPSAAFGYARVLRATPCDATSRGRGRLPGGQHLPPPPAPSAVTRTDGTGTPPSPDVGPPRQLRLCGLLSVRTLAHLDAQISKLGWSDHHGKRERLWNRRSPAHYQRSH